ncbi:MAG: hypothetical protein ACOZEN_10020 [Thermodesulfobacteriota bacterium]
MFKSLSLVAAMFAVVSFATFCFAQGGKPNDMSELHSGFRGIKWGSSISDVQAGGIQFGTFDAVGKAINVPVTAGTPLNVNNIPVKMSFTFIDKKFSGVVIVPADVNKTQDVTSFFIRQFGQPVFSAPQKQMHAWQDSKVTITVQVANNAVAFIVMSNANFKAAGLKVDDYVKMGADAAKPKPGGI